MSVNSLNTHAKIRAAARQSSRSYAEQFTPTKDDLRNTLAEAARNTAALEQQQKVSDHQS